MNKLKTLCDCSQSIAIQCNLMRFNVIQCDSMWFNAIHCDSLWLFTIIWKTGLLCVIMRYYALLCVIMHSVRLFGVFRLCFSLVAMNNTIRSKNSICRTPSHEQIRSIEKIQFRHNFSYWLDNILMMFITRRWREYCWEDIARLDGRGLENSSNFHDVIYVGCPMKRP